MRGGAREDPGSPALTCIAGHGHLREVGAEDSVVKVAGLWGEEGGSALGEPSGPTHGIATRTSPTLAGSRGVGPGRGSSDGPPCTQRCKTLGGGTEVGYTQGQQGGQAAQHQLLLTAPLTCSH